VEEDEEETLPAKEVRSRTPEVKSDVEAQINALRGGGRPLPESERTFFEPRLGSDFSQVRIHTDSRAAQSARAIHALAYTIGHDIVFGASQYVPETHAGKHLLAHELTHVLQQRNRSVSTLHVPGHRRTPLGSVPSVQRITGEELTSGASTGVLFLPADLGQQSLQIGSVGPAVTLLQEMLNRLSITPEPLDVDGIFGPQTEAAVVTFQAVQGLEPDGIVGPLTNAKLAAIGGPAPLASGCPPYSKAELAASRDSGGRFDQPSAVGPTVAQQALMWDFEQGKAVIRPGHIAGALKMVIDLGLNTTAPSATIAIMLGHTDCVDKESTNAPIRAGRANVARELFKDVGAREEHIGPAEPATLGPVPGDDRTAIGRAQNRSAVIIVMEPTKRDDGQPPASPDPRKRPCNANADPGQDWSLQSLSSAAAAGGVGAGLFVFELKNRKSGCAYQCLFVGFGGGLGVGVSISAPSSKKFTTPEFFVNPKDLQGDASVFSASIGVGPAAVAHAFIRFRAVKTEPNEIDIGGLQAGFGAEIGVIGLEGKFFVEKKGIRRAADL